MTQDRYGSDVDASHLTDLVAAAAGESMIRMVRTSLVAAGVTREPDRLHERFGQGHVLLALSGALDAHAWRGGRHALWVRRRPRIEPEALRLLRKLLPMIGLYVGHFIFPRRLEAVHFSPWHSTVTITSPVLPVDGPYGQWVVAVGISSSYSSIETRHFEQTGFVSG